MENHRKAGKSWENIWKIIQKIFEHQECWRGNKCSNHVQVKDLSLPLENKWDMDQDADIPQANTSFSCLLGQFMSDA